MQEKQAVNPLCYSLQGRLVLSSSGWYLLEVPNDLGNGLFKALNESDVEQPTTHSEVYNAHVSIIRPEELEEIGGPSKVTQRGQAFSFNIGPVREIKSPAGWSKVSKVWAADITSPALMALRRNLGLGPPNFPFHLTVAVRKRKVRKKAASVIYGWGKLASDTKEEQEDKNDTENSTYRGAGDGSSTACTIITVTRKIYHKTPSSTSAAGKGD